MGGAKVLNHNTSLTKISFWLEYKLAVNG